MDCPRKCPVCGSNHLPHRACPPTIPDPVQHPDHYTRGGIEVIDAIEAWDLGFRLGNAIKYIARAGHKGDRLEDLRKARWYLDREIQKATP